jgi:CRP-like cAMP-binding protein
MNDIDNRILNSLLGAEFTPEEAVELGGIMSWQKLADGDYLFREGTADDALHVLLEGKLEVVKQTGAGETASLAVLRDGELAGELSFVDGETHTVGLRALCDCGVMSLKRSDFEALVTSNPQLVYKVMRAVARSAHRIVHRMNHEFIELSNYIFKQHGRY